MRLDLFLSCLLLLVSLCGTAWSAHITDKLVVGLYAGPEAVGTPLQLLSSGTPLEVLRSKEGFAEVRISDEQTGWVEASYVTEEKPAKAVLLETQARLRQMGLELARLREQSGEDSVAQFGPGADETDAMQQALEEARSRIDELEAALAERETDTNAGQRLDRLQTQVRSAVDQLAKTQGLIVRPAAGEVPEGFVARYQKWIIGGSALLLGFASGIAFIDYRIRRRYGGFRI